MLFLQNPSHALVPSEPSQADRLLQMSLTQYSSVGELIEVAVDGLDVSLWSVPNVADAACLVRQEMSRGRIWTAQELMNLRGLPDLTADDIRLITVAKREFAGQVVSVQPR